MKSRTVFENPKKFDQQLMAIARLKSKIMDNRTETMTLESDRNITESRIMNAYTESRSQSQY